MLIKIRTVKNILLAAGLYQEGIEIDEQFVIKARLVDLDTGTFSLESDISSFDQRKSAKDPSQSMALTSDQDQAKISRRENQALVYIVESKGEFDKIILPVHGYGLWSPFMALLPLRVI